MRYCFWGSSIKFRGHRGWKIDDLNPNRVRLLGRSQLSNPSDLPCYHQHLYYALLLVRNRWNWHDDVIKWKHLPRYWPFSGNSPVAGDFPAQRPVTRNFDVSFDLRLNKRLSKHSWGWRFETLLRPLSCHCNVSHFNHARVLYMVAQVKPSAIVSVRWLILTLQ